MLTAIVLAAGRASRMGTLKQLLPWQDGRTILETVVHTVLACPELDDVRVVLGAGEDQTRAVLKGIDDPRLRIMENPNYNNGMLSSIQLGLRELPEASKGFIIFLGDQPLIEPPLVRALIQHWNHLARPDFLVPVHQGRRGHPVLVSTKYVGEINGMADNQGGLRELIRSYSQRVEVLEVESPAIHIDLDYPEEYRKYRPRGGKEMNLVVIRGAGEMASGTAHRLYKAGYKVIMSELPQPLAVRRTVAFAQAVFDGSCTVEGVTGQRTESLSQALTLSGEGKIPVFIGKLQGRELDILEPGALIDATMAKENLGTGIEEAPVVIALGPGFTAGVDADAVIETNRGHDLGRVLYSGSAQANTGDPGNIGGFTGERIVKFPKAGVFRSDLQIGDPISAGEVFGYIGDQKVLAELSGIVRGLLMPGTWVLAGTKLGDIDPRGNREYCYTISEKARAIAGGVLEALLFCCGGVK